MFSCAPSGQRGPSRHLSRGGALGALRNDMSCLIGPDDPAEWSMTGGPRACHGPPSCGVFYRTLLRLLHVAPYVMDRFGPSFSVLGPRVGWFSCAIYSSATI